MVLIMAREESKYYLCLSSEKNIPQGSIVGEFRHHEDKDFSFFIVLDDETVKQARHRELCVTMAKNESGKDCAVAYINSAVLRKFQQRRFHLSALWHELGHIHNGDYEEGNAVPSNEIGKIRNQCINEGKVMDKELRADEFACRLAGKRNMIKLLESLIQEREQLNDKNQELAIKEMRLLIAHLLAYKSK
jgi:hypothetical protein